jgi:hypothetical protein
VGGAEVMWQALVERVRKADGEDLGLFFFGMFFLGLPCTLLAFGGMVVLIIQAARGAL